jgi:hypothetical protein
MEIFLRVNENNEVFEWGTNLLIDGEVPPSVEIEENHPFFQNPSAYVFVDGTLQLKEGE